MRIPVVSIINEGEESQLLAIPGSSPSRWRPTQMAFSSYDNGGPNPQSSYMRLVVRKSLVARVTKDLLETYQLCNPHFQYSQTLNPKRFLTTPSIGLLNDANDNANSDLILSVNYDLLHLDTQTRYIVKDILGHGTFGQVA